MPNKIQSREHSKDSDIDGCVHNTDSNGNPNVFNLEHDSNGVWLNTNYVKPENRWLLEGEFVFVSRNSLHFSPALPAGEFRE